MSPAGAEARIERWLAARAGALAAALVALGAAARLRSASSPFLAPDEALHLKIASGAGVAEVYRQSLYNAHPPLFVLLLHFWKGVAHSDWTLRLLPVTLGSLFLWAAWAWTKRLLGESAGLLALAFLALLPSVVMVSAELRGYALLLCCVAAALACLEKALDEESPAGMLAFGALGILALSSHYAAFRFVAAAFVYSATRIAAGPRSGRLVAAWAGAFAALAAAAAFLAATHVSRLLGGPLESEVRSTWLAEDYYRRGDGHPFAFVGRQTISLFHYFFSSTLAGAIGLALFLAGVALLARMRRPSSGLLFLPVALGAAGGLLSVYPYGGTRHSIDLVLFVAAGAGVALSRLTGERRWVVVIVAAFLAPAAFLAVR